MYVGCMGMNTMHHRDILRNGSGWIDYATQKSNGLIFRFFLESLPAGCKTSYAICTFSWWNTKLENTQPEMRYTFHKID